MKDIAIGEVGEIDGVKVRCVVAKREGCCTGCCGATHGICISTICQSFARKDEVDVIFEAVTK